MKQQITNLIYQALIELKLPQIDFLVEKPKVTSHGDFASNVAMIMFPKLKEQEITEYSNPKQLAESIKTKLLASNFQLLTSVEVAGPGFINITINNHYYINKLSEILTAKYDWGTSQINAGKEVIVEYSSPNIAKPFTIGHLRSTIIGDCIANLKAATGWQVYRDNHLGDWGTQFGKQIYAIKTWGNVTEIENSQEPVKLLVDLYVKFHDEAEKNPQLEDFARFWFKKLEDGNQEARILWQKCIDWSWKEFSSIYDELNIHHTENNGHGYGESFFENQMQPVIDELNQKNLLKDGKEGAKIVEYSKTNLPPLMILKKDGASLYATRDLATDKFRLNHYGKNIYIINEVGAEQSLYFSQLYQLEQMLGWFKSEQRIHVGHGLYRFKTGKMSTRKGNTIWLKDVIAEAKSRVYEIANTKNLTDFDIKAIAIGAIKYNDLKRKPKEDINFDWNEILSMDGNTGPYLQYTVARCRSVITKSQQTNKAQKELASDLSQVERALLTKLTSYPEIIQEAEQNHHPSTLCTYVQELASDFNTFYNSHPIQGNQLRLQLTQATDYTLTHALKILGIIVPTKM